MIACAADNTLAFPAFFELQRALMIHWYFVARRTQHVSFIAYGRVADPVAMVVSPAFTDNSRGFSRGHQRIRGNGFGASIDIRNTGPTINGWNLVFNFPNGQRIQNGWPVTFTQPAGSPTVTVSSNAPWNATLSTNAVFNVA